MNRRAFLKCVAALTGSAVIPAGATYVIEELAFAVEKPSAWPIGVLREVMAYDIAQDKIFLRFDVLVGSGTDPILSANRDAQLHVTFEWSTKQEAIDLVEEQRKIAKKILGDEIKRRGFDVSQARPMMIPRGVCHAQNT